MEINFSEDKNRMIEEVEQKQIRRSFECGSCGTIIKTPLDVQPQKCSCGANNWKVLFTEYYTESQYKKALENFKDKQLLKLILEELSRNHLADNNLKMTAFLVAVSGLLNNQKQRMSMALKGDSSSGKDNLMRTILKQMPRDIFLFLTNATQSVLEDDVKGKRIIAFSELNEFREAGSNSHLIEIIKQLTEGGTESLKKDIRTGLKSSRHEKQEQTSILFGTTETEKDQERETRFIEGGVKTDQERVRKVNDKTCDTFSDMDSLLEQVQEEDSFLRIGLTNFFNNSKVEVVLPYAKYLKDKIGENYIFDNSNPRSQRDLKRILSLTCAMTYLFQEQRQIIDYKGTKFLISEPQDFINTLKISAEFFNQSYSGLDPRLMEVLRIMKEYGQEWTPRDYLEEKLDVSKNTIKHYCNILAGEGYQEGVKGSDLNYQTGLKVYDGNKIYYRRCQKGVKKPLIRCQILELKQFLEEKTKNTIDTFDFLETATIKEDNDTSKGVKIEGVKTEEGYSNPIKIKEKDASGEEIDTFSLTPFNEEEIKSTGLESEIKEILQEKVK